MDLGRLQDATGTISQRSRPVLPEPSLIEKHRSVRISEEAVVSTRILEEDDAQVLWLQWRRTLHTLAKHDRSLTHINGAIVQYPILYKQMAKERANDQHQSKRWSGIPVCFDLIDHALVKVRAEAERPVSISCLH